jgi:hypothetical protein
MRKLAALCGLLALCALPVMAQDQTPAPTDQSKPATPPAPAAVKRTYPLTKYEVSGGFTHRIYDLAPNTSLGMNGWYGSFDYNFLKKLGAEAEVLGVSASAPAIPPPSVRIYAIYGGPRVYPFGHHKLTPFVRGLIGEGLLSSTTSTFAGLQGTTLTHNGRVWEAGGGLDYSFSQHWGIRVTAGYGGGNLSGANPNSNSTFYPGGSRRISVGVVYRFGDK